MAPSLLQGSSPRPPRRGARIYHPISSYIPFFIFVATLVVVVLIIFMLVGRLLSALPSSGVGAAATSTPTSQGIVGPAPPTTPIGQPSSSGYGALPPALVFSQSVETNGSPGPPATSFVSTAPRVYAFITLHQVPAAAEVRFVWTYRSPALTTLADVREHQQGPAYTAYTFVSYATPNGPTFVTGVYTVSVTLANHPVALGHFRIVPA